MKLKRLLSVVGLGLFAAVSAGAGVALSSKPKAQAVKADGGYSGSVIIQKNDTDMRWEGCKLTAYLFDSSNNAWGTPVQNTDSLYQTYSWSGLSFEPESIIILRVQDDWSSDWENPWLNFCRTGDITIGAHDVIWMYGDARDTNDRWGEYDVDAVVKGGATDDWSVATVDTALTHVKTDGSKLEVYGSVSLPADTYFKVLKTGSTWCGNYSALASIQSNLSGGGESNIHNTAAANYEFYFDYDNLTIYITDPVVAAADEWSQYFLSHVGCDATGVNLPTGWTDCATEYGKLGNDVKDYIYGATAKEDGTYTEHAVKRYDVAVAHHPSLTRFIVNSGDTPRAALATNIVGTNSPTIKVETSTMIAVVSIIAIVSISSIVVLVVIKKRKHN